MKTTGRKEAKANTGKAAKKPAKVKKSVPWEERRNDVLAKARERLREVCAAGRAALGHVEEAAKPEPASYHSDAHSVRTLAIRVKKTGEIAGVGAVWKEGTPFKTIEARLRKAANEQKHLSDREYTIIRVTMNF